MQSKDDIKVKQQHGRHFVQMFALARLTKLQASVWLCFKIWARPSAPGRRLESPAISCSLNLPGLFQILGCQQTEYEWHGTDMLHLIGHRASAPSPLSKC